MMPRYVHTPIVNSALIRWIYGGRFLTSQTFHTIDPGDHFDGRGGGGCGSWTEEPLSFTAQHQQPSGFGVSLGVVG